MYRLFYNLKVTGDVLYIVMDEESKPDKVVNDGVVTSLYKDNKIIGINIFNISEVVKLKTNGMIVTPEDALIDVINSILERHNIEKLPKCTSSGYKVMKITKLEEHPIDEKAHIVTLSCGNENYQSVSRYPNLKEGMLVVAIIDDVIKFDGTTFHSYVAKNINVDVELCCGKELRVNEEFKEVFIPEGYSHGDDFFLGGN